MASPAPIAISYFLPIRQFLNPLVIFLSRHCLFTSECSNADHTVDFSGKESEELFHRTDCLHRSPTEIGARLLLETYALLIRKAIPKEDR